MSDFRAFAATGDVGQVTEIVSGKEGPQSCQAPTYYVAVNSGLTPKEVEADLSAFAVRHGWLGPLNLWATLPTGRVSPGQP